MKRKVISLFAAVLILAFSAIPALAAEPRLVDEANLLSEAESVAVAKKLDEIATRYGLDVVIVTTDSTEGKSPMEYADDYYDSHGYGEDGILLLVSMEEGEWWITTAGYGIRAFTDAGIEYIGDQVIPLLSDGDYAGAFEAFADLCDDFLAQAQNGDPYDTHNLPGKPFRLMQNLAVSLVVGLVAAFLATGTMKRKLKSVTQKAQADDYVTPGSLNLTHSRDFHLYTRLERTEKPKADSGSSTHTSSSGVTHGGGGGKF